MEIKKLANNSLNFIIKRFIEFFGLGISITSLLLLASLLSYSPEDPNFVFPENTKIQNILGFKGSFVSDLFFQSLGLISILVAVSLFFIGINIIKSKQAFLLITNLFYTVLYSLIGTLFFSSYHSNSFWLSINGNGGFVGNFLENTFLTSLINLNKEVLKVAKTIASKSNLTIKIGKQAFYKQLEMPLRKAYAYTSRMMTLNMMSIDAHEGISAFLNKRKPKWKNK